jgi:hypothetical protein
MFTIVKRAFVLGAVALSLGTLATSAGMGQGLTGGGFTMPGAAGGGIYRPPVGGAGGGYINPLAGLLGGATMSSYPSSGYGQPSGDMGYPGYNLPDPYSGYLKGSADVIKAQGQNLKDTQQAYLMAEDVKRAKLAYRRANYEEWLWERANLPTLEDERIRTAKENLRRAQNDPPLPEIWSGQSLNTLLNNAQTMVASNKGQLPNVALDEDVISKINLNSGKGGVNFGLLKNEGKLSWPLAIRNLEPAGEAKEVREQLQALTEASVKKAKEGPVDPGTYREMEACADKLEKMLRKNISDMPFSEYTESKRYLTNLRDGLKALREPNAADFANGKFKLKGNTVKDLVEYMAKNGLQFAPAVGGEEGAYVALQRALVAFSQGAGAGMAAER